MAEAAANEFGQVRVLHSQIAITPRGSYRDGLEEHLRVTRDHARRVQERLRELDGAGSPLQAFVAFTERLIEQPLSSSTVPFDLPRGSGGEEKVLKQAKDAYAAAAFEIAAYTALERLAIGVDDRQTGALAASIRRDEQRMLDRILRELPALSDAVVAADIEDETAYAIRETGAVDFARLTADDVEEGTAEVADEIEQMAHANGAGAGRAAQQARMVPGVAQLENCSRG